MRALVLVAVLAGCYDPPLPTCGFLCGPGDTCPAGFTCNSGTGGDFRCYAGTPEPSECEPVDSNGPPTVDVGLPEVVELGFTSVQLYFSEIVTGVDARTVRITRDDGVLVTALVTSWNFETTYGEIRFAPEALEADRTYTLAVDGPIRDSAGYRVRPYSRVFTVNRDRAPAIVSSFPMPGSAGVSVRPEIQVEFSEPVIDVTASTFFLLGPDGVVRSNLRPPFGDNSFWVETLVPVPQLAPPRRTR